MPRAEEAAGAGRARGRRLGRQTTWWPRCWQPVTLNLPTPAPPRHPPPAPAVCRRQTEPPV